MAERRLDGDEAGQILVLGSEPVEHPGAHARALELEHAGVELQQRGAVIDAIADHRADHAKVVHARGDIRKQRADRNAALAVLLERPWRLHQAADIVLAERQAALERHRLAVILVQARLWIERVDARRPAVHEQEDDAFDRGGSWGALGDSGFTVELSAKKRDCKPSKPKPAAD